MGDLWKSCIGLYVGQLNPDERASFDAAVKRGEAVQWYEGPASMFGLGKVRSTDQRSEHPEAHDDYEWFHDSDMGAR
jgi:hypothetical protein